MLRKRINAMILRGFLSCICLASISILPLPKALNGQNPLKIKEEGGVYVIPCKVNGLALNMIFDTGAADVLISPVEALFMLRNGYLSEDDIGRRTSFMTADGEIKEGISLILRRIEIADTILRDVDATVSSSISAPLLLGQSAIRQLGRFELDYHAKTLTIYSDKSTVGDVRVHNKTTQNSGQRFGVLYETIPNELASIIDVFLRTDPNARANVLT